MNLKVGIEEIDKELEGTLGVAVKNLETGEEVMVNGDAIFPLASVFKIPVIVTLYRMVDAGKINLDDKMKLTDYARVPGSGILKELTRGMEMTVRDYRTLMMIISDNTATDMIVDLVGKENVNSAMIELGLEKTKISTCREIFFGFLGLRDVDPKEWTIELWNEMIKKMREGTFKPLEKPIMKMYNVSTPRDMMILLEKICRGEAASRESCDEIISLMKKCQTGENRILKYLPKGKVEVAHKTGTVKLKHPPREEFEVTHKTRIVRGVVNDVGIVFPKDKEPYVVCAFTKDIEAEAESYVPIGEEAIAKVSKITYDYFAHALYGLK